MSRKNNFKIFMYVQKQRVILRMKSRVGGVIIFGFRLFWNYSQSMVLVENRVIDQFDRIEFRKK